MDAATCVCGLENLPPAESVAILREAHRALKPGGALVVAHVNKASYFELLRLARRAMGRRDVQYVLAPDPSLGPFTPLASAEVDALVRDAGFTVEHTHRALPLPPPDEAQHRVRSFHNALSALQYPVAATYRVTQPLHQRLGRLGKIRFLTLRKA